MFSSTPHINNSTFIPHKSRHLNKLSPPHDTSQLRENRSHQYFAAEQLSVSAAEQLSVGAGWAGMVWADMFNVPAPSVQN